VQKDDRDGLGEIICEKCTEADALLIASAPTLTADNARMREALTRCVEWLEGIRAEIPKLDKEQRDTVYGVVMDNMPPHFGINIARAALKGE
jgi:hypothetical protein